MDNLNVFKNYKICIIQEKKTVAESVNSFY